MILLLSVNTSEYTFLIRKEVNTNLRKGVNTN